MAGLRHRACLFAGSVTHLPICIGGPLIIVSPMFLNEFSDFEIRYCLDSTRDPLGLGNKTDRTDAKGLFEAHRNDATHHVAVNSVEQGTHPAEWVARNDSPKCVRRLSG